MGVEGVHWSLTWQISVHSFVTARKRQMEIYATLDPHIQPSLSPDEPRPVEINVSFTEPWALYSQSLSMKASPSPVLAHWSTNMRCMRRTSIWYSENLMTGTVYEGGGLYGHPKSQTPCILKFSASLSGPLNYAVNGSNLVSHNSSLLQAHAVVYLWLKRTATICKLTCRRSVKSFISKIQPHDMESTFGREL